MIVSVVVPAHNEEKRLGSTLEDYIRFFSTRTTINVEFVVVTNGCNDSTPQIARELAGKYACVRAIDIPARIGKGGAVVEGIRAATGDIIAFVDADGATSPSEVWRLVESVQNGADGAIGSRWLPGSVISVKQPISRRVASRGFNMLVRVMFGFPFRDTQCGAKTFKGPVLKELANDLTTTGWAFDVDLLWTARKRGCRVEEVPIRWNDTGRSSFVLQRDPPRMFKDLMKLRFRSGRTSVIADTGKNN